MSVRVRQARHDDLAVENNSDVADAMQESVAGEIQDRSTPKL